MKTLRMLVLALAVAGIGMAASNPPPATRVLSIQYFNRADCLIFQNYLPDGCVQNVAVFLVSSNPEVAAFRVILDSTRPDGVVQTQAIFSVKLAGVTAVVFWNDVTDITINKVTVVPLKAVDDVITVP